MCNTVKVSLTDVKGEGGGRERERERERGREKERKREREKKKKERKKEAEREHTATTHRLYQSHISSPCPDETTHRSTDREVCRILHLKSPATKQVSASTNVVLYFT